MEHDPWHCRDRQTITFTVLTVSQLFHSLAVRSESASLLLFSTVLLVVELEKFLVRRKLIYTGS